MAFSFYRRPAMAERAAIALCRRIELPAGAPPWHLFNVQTKVDWAAFRRRGIPGRPDVKTVTNFRLPPLPGQAIVFGKHRPNTCPVCCQPTYGAGDWRASAGKPRWNRSWHECCLRAHSVWKFYAGYAHYLARRQGGKCAITGDRILGSGDRDYLIGDVQVDHVVPLWKVHAERDLHGWPDVLHFWGLQNLQAVSVEGHKIKSKREAQERAAMRARAGTLPLFPEAGAVAE